MNWSIGNIMWIIIGGSIIGIVARVLLPGRQSIPFWSVIVAGILGMFAGDWVAGLLGVKETGGYDWIRHGIQVVAALVLVAGAAKVFGGKDSSDRSA